MSNIIWFALGVVAGVAGVHIWVKSAEVYDDVVFEKEIEQLIAAEKPKRGRPKGSKNKPKLPEQY